MSIICKICLSTDTVFLFLKNGFKIKKCKKCNVVFTDIQDNFDFTSIYTEQYFQGGQNDGYNNYKGSESVLHSEFIRDVDFLSNYAKKGAKLLELGSAYGFFLDVARHNFIVDGLEIAKDAVAFSRDRGHTVYEGILDTAANKLGQRDIICMFDVIEHLPDPCETFKIIDNLLTKNGLLFLTTGNIDSFLARLTGKNWRLMTPPQHTFFYSKRTLRLFLKKFNYDILFMDSPSKLVPIGLVFYQFYRMTRIRIKFLEKITNHHLRINLFDTVRILARKTN